MKLKRVSPIIAMLLVGLMSGCNKNSVEKSLSPGMSSETMSSFALQQKGGNLAVVYTVCMSLTAVVIVAGVGTA